MKNLSLIVLAVFCLVLCISCGSEDTDSGISHIIADGQTGYSNILQSDGNTNTVATQAGTNATITSVNYNSTGDSYWALSGTFLRDGSAMLGYRFHTYSIATTMGTSFTGVNTLQFDYRYSGDTGAKVYLALVTGDNDLKNIYTDMSANSVTLINDNAWHTISIPLDNGMASSSDPLSDVISDLGVLVIMIYSTDDSAPGTPAVINEFAIDDVILRN